MRLDYFMWAIARRHAQAVVIDPASTQAPRRRRKRERHAGSPAGVESLKAARGRPRRGAQT